MLLCKVMLNLVSSSGIRFAFEESITYHSYRRRFSSDSQKMSIRS
jgi:hypothetical protein